MQPLSDGRRFTVIKRIQFGLRTLPGGVSMNTLRSVVRTGCLASAVLASFVHAQDQPSRRITTPGAPGSQVQINQIETSQFPKVVVFATVLKDGQPVHGLTARDFRVREDEVDQEPLTVVPKLTPLSAVMTLDTSGSMKRRLSDAQGAAKSFLNTLEPQDKVQVVRFSRDVKTIFPLGSDRAAAAGAIDVASLESLQNVPGRKAIVLLSDGVDDDGTGKPLSSKTVTDVLALARRVNVPIYAIGLGTELDEVNLRKVATDSGALYLNATEPTELKRLYDSIGKQLAGQYTINYTSNLPADGSEHRVQLKVGEITSTKSYLPPTRVAVTQKPPVEPPSAPPASAEAAPGTAISDKAPSSDLNAPVPLTLGEVVKGRLGKSDETKKYHYWLLDLPAGHYKFVLDVKRADERDSNIGGELSMMKPDGKEGKKIGRMIAIDHRHRSVFRIEAEKPLQGVLRYENSYTISDYHLGVFRESDRLNGLFFVKPPPVAPIKLGQTVTTPLLEGDNTQKRDAYYSLTLPAGDYKVSVEYRRQDKRDSNVGGAVSALDPDGDQRIERVVAVIDTGPAHQGAAKLSLADEAHLVFKVRVAYTKETAVFSVEEWKD
jgi:Mg-chelatase subunit ChlD